jgi:hypothetical protein
MMKNLVSSLSITIFLYLFFSCQKEINFEASPPSVGSLKKDLNNNCLPIITGGTYFAGQNIGDSNYIEVEVNVTIPGSYIISTNTVNGYSFKTTGRFTNTGSARIRLTGIGKPIAAGNNNFIVRYDTSSCQVSIPVSNSGNTASFTLQGSPNTCMNDTVVGSYVKACLLDTSNKVKISVNVTIPGTYTISTNTINGYNFSRSGSFTATGIQTIILAASGTPVNQGTDVFTVTGGASTCTFSIPVLPAIVPPNNDYFPLTTNSHWTYDDLFRPGDSVTRKIIDSVVITGTLYKIMEERPGFVGPFQYNFRKTGSDYYEYGSADKYTNSFQFGSQTTTDIPFLKENLTTGDSWQSPEYTGTATFGQVLTIQYNYSCLNANAGVVINGNAFANVYKIKMMPQIKSINNPYGSTGEVYTYYYAKGIGLIYLKETRDGFTLFELQIRNWLVN